MTPRALLVTIALLATAAPLGRARADGVVPDPQAVELFDQGRKLVVENKCADAIPKFEQSIKRSRTVGAMLNLAECEQKVGKLASAWAAFRAASGFAKDSGDGERAKFAAARAAALEPKLAKLTISVSPAASRIPGLTVTRAEAPVAAEEFNLPLALDAGTYTMRATAPGRIAWSKDVTIVGEGTRFLVTVPELVPSEEPAPVPAPPPAPAPVEPPPAPAPTPVAPPPRPTPERAASTWSPQKTVAVGAGAAGIVALGGGIFFAIQSGGKSSTADAHDATTASLVAFVASGLLLGSGAILYFTSPKAARTTALRVAPGGLALDGAF